MARPFDKPPRIGTVFTYLTFIGNYRIINKKGVNISYVDVKCQCGTILTVKLTSLKSGRKKSCGCLVKEISKKRWFKNGKSKTKEYRAWIGMIKRCYDPKYKLYHRYGGRGISVCDRWRNSLNYFILDMGNCPKDKTSIDRYPNNNGNYEPANCRWATDKEQGNNRCSNRVYEINGISKNINQWCELYKIDYKLVHARLFKCNWPILKALTMPIADSKFKPKNDKK